MAVNAYDLQICLWKILKLSSETCVTLSTRHPFFACSLLFLFLLYMLFPLMFWIVIYSFPVVVCTWIVLSISFTLRDGKKYAEEENDRKYGRKAADEFVIGENKKSFARVHSVRRRRAKDIWRENNTKSKVEEKNAICSINLNHDVVDKNALSEESPKEIREVEIDQNSQVNTTKGNSSPVYHIGILKDLKDDEQDKDDDDDEQKNAMDIGISEVERNKRLESLIARRRSRKLLSLQVRRTLMNMDRNDQTTQIPSLIIPKMHSSVPSPFSPVPGSAPSVLVPMRNPFDLPYDPQEEKPDLTGDSFQQEFLPINNTRDMIFCRHESFSLGIFSPGEFNHNREETSFVHGQRASFQGNQFCKPENESEQQSHQLSEAKPTSESAGDQIKEIIEVYEDDIANHNEEDINEVQTTHVQQKDFTSGSSSPSSSEEDEPVHKIDKEAILKSLSSMARRNIVEETENDDQEEDDQLDYDTFPFENSTRLEEQYYTAGKTMRRHAPSYSIASDLQVEVSEVSSPPTTIDENLSYHDENMSTYDEDMEKNTSSHLSEVDENESRSKQVTEVSEQDIIKFGFARIDESVGTTMSNSMEESLNEMKLPSEVEFCDRGRGRATNLDEKIHQTFERSISSKEKSHGSDFGKPMDNNINQMEPAARIEPESDEHILGQQEKSDECNEMEQLSTKSIKSSEDLEELADEHVNIESVEHTEGVQISTEINTSQTALVPNDSQASSLMRDELVEQFSLVQNSPLLSPKSVLLPTFSMDRSLVSSYDHDTDEDVQRFSTRTAEVSSPVAVMEQSTALPCYDGDVESIEESAEPSKTYSIEANDTESISKQKMHENGIELNEGYGDSSQRQGTPADHVDDSNSSLAIEEELSRNQEKVIEEATNNIHRNKPSSDEEKLDEPQHFDTNESPIVLSGLVEDYGNSESWKTTNSHEPKAVPEDKLETMNASNGESK